MASRLLTQEQVGEIFSFYSNFGRSSAMTFQESMDNVAFAKLARECPGLLDRAVTPVDVDLVFTKAKPKHERRLDFEHFLDALAAVAAKKFPEQPPADGLRLLLAHHLAPLHDAVQLEMQKTGETEVPLTGVFKKLYDVRSYTGVYAERFRSGDGRINGDTDNRPGRAFTGSTNTGTDETIHDVSVLFRPNLHGAGTMLSPTNHALRRRQSSAKPAAAAEARGGAAGGPPSSPSYGGGSASRRGASPTGRESTAGGGSRRAGAASPSRSVSRVTASGSSASYAAAGGGSSSVSLGDSDARALLEAAARARAGDSSDLLRLAEAIAHRQTAPAAPAASASADDDASWGGGGGGGARRHQLHRGGIVDDGGGGAAAGAPADLGGSSDGDDAAAAHRAVLASPPRLSQEEVEAIFAFYANFGRSHVQTFQESIDSFMFAKFARECPGLLGGGSGGGRGSGGLHMSDVDLIFTKAKPKFERRLQFSHFLDALAAIAERKYPSFAPADGLRLLLAHHLAPLHDAVQLEMQKTGETEVPLTGVFKKLYDVRSYTGVYAERFRSGDGRINGDADNRPGRAFTGSTNTGTDETIHDVSVLFRPNLRSGTLQATRVIPPGGSPRAAMRSASPSRAGGGGGGGPRTLRSPSHYGSDARSSSGYGADS